MLEGKVPVLEGQAGAAWGPRAQNRNRRRSCPALHTPQSREGLAPLLAPRPVGGSCCDPCPPPAAPHTSRCLALSSWLLQGTRLSSAFDCFSSHLSVRETKTSDEAAAVCWAVRTQTLSNGNHFLSSS